MGSIYLIRHGQASFGADDYDVLSALGQQQAELLGGHLAQLGIRLDRCISGDLRRQRDTARSALERCADAGLEVPALEIDPAFNEFDAEAVIRALLPAIRDEEPAALEILRNPASQRAAFQRLFARIITLWLEQPAQVPPALRWEHFADQVQAGLQRILASAEQGQQIAVFTSGGSITALLHRLTAIPAGKAFELNWQIINTSLSRLQFRNGQTTLASFNSRSHLELLKRPELITYR